MPYTKLSDMATEALLAAMAPEAKDGRGGWRWPRRATEARLATAAEAGSSWSS